MSMNRQQKRMLQKQGEIDADGAPVRTRKAPTNQPPQERTSPMQFFREVGKELKLVSWPTRDEVINYSLVVFTLLIVFTGIVAGMDYLLGEGVVKLFER